MPAVRMRQFPGRAMVTFPRRPDCYRVPEVASIERETLREILQQAMDEIRSEYAFNTFRFSLDLLRHADDAYAQKRVGTFRQAFATYRPNSLDGFARRGGNCISQARQLLERRLKSLGGALVTASVPTRMGIHISHGAACFRYRSPSGEEGIFLVDPVFYREPLLFLDGFASQSTRIRHQKIAGPPAEELELISRGMSLFIRSDRGMGGAAQPLRPAAH